MYLVSPSGVGSQMKYILHGLMKTGKYRIISLGGAIKHSDYKLQKTQEFGDDWLIIPVDGYGTQEIVRSVIRNYRPDVLLFMTDPRFFIWLWQIENEIRPLLPMVYYHVWDNFPYPKFNKPLYESNDAIITISKLTSSIVKNVAPNVEEHYLSHAVDMTCFRKLEKDITNNFKNQNFPYLIENPDKLMFFWNNRNARRKQSGTIIWWFKEFLDKVGHDKACLLMHTDPKDGHGQDLNAIVRDLGLAETNSVMISQEKVPPGALSLIYNVADCTINMADAEGFGLATAESLACETPIIVNMTGGMQEQVTEITEEVTEEMMLKRNKNKSGITQYEHGFGIEPSSKAVIGSQQVPYIYEDRVSKKDFIEALTKMINLSKEERERMGKRGRDHLLKNYNFENFTKQWDQVITAIHEKHGSWDTRKNHKSWKLIEI